MYCITLFYIQLYKFFLSDKPNTFLFFHKHSSTKEKITNWRRIMLCLLDMVIIILCWECSWLIVIFAKVLIHEVVTLSFHTLPHALSINFLVLGWNFIWTTKKSEGLLWFIDYFVLPPLILLLILFWMRRRTEKTVLILNLWGILNRTFSNRCN